MQKVNKTIIHIPSKQSGGWTKDQVVPDQSHSKHALTYLHYSLESIEVDLLQALEVSTQQSEKKASTFFDQSYFLSTLSGKISHLMISIFS